MNKESHRTRWLIASIALLFVIVGAGSWILTNRSTFSAIISVIFTGFGIIVGLLQWLFPFSSTPSGHISEGSHNFPAVHQVQPIPSHVPAVQAPPGEATPVNHSYRRIVGFPVLTHRGVIQQRDQLVKAVYTQLTQTNVTAVALTGIGGVGKSTLASLIHRYVEEQQTMHASPFLSGTLWLTVDPTVTFADIIGNVFEALDMPIPDLSDLAPHTQAVTLFNALNATDKPRLIIFDQFENLLDWKTGHALADRPGVGEWLDIMNSQQCTCRFLLTSRPRPIGTREEPPVHLQEHPVEALEIAEAVALLRNREVDGTEEELQTAVIRCEGHALSLSLLASLIHDHRLSLTILLQDPALWIDNIARRLLDYLYTKQLDHVQRSLLVAFSVYREPVSLKAAEAVITNAPESQIPDALQVLWVQRLIEPTGDGHYQLHAIIAEYAHGHFDESNKQANSRARREKHKLAAQYYRKQAMTSYPPFDERGNVSDIHDLLEAIWHYYQAEQWQEAYTLNEQEGVFSCLQQWGSNAILLELCLELKRQKGWSPPPLQAGDIHRYMAWAYNAQGKRELAKKCNEEALELYIESGNLEGQGKILDALGWSFKAMGHMKEAEGYYIRALAIYEETGDRRAEGNVLNGLGQACDIQGQREQARKYFEQALALCKDAGDSRLKWRRLEGRTLRNLGYMHTDLGHYTEALGCLEQSLVIRKKSDRRGEGVACDFSGRVYRERGREYKEQGRVYREQGQDEKAAQEFKKAVQDFERAEQEFRKSLSIYQAVGDRGLEGWALHNLGWTYNGLGQYERAREFLEQALPIRQEVGDRRGESRTMRDLGEASSMLGQKKQALEYYKQALLISGEIPDPYGKGTILQNAALIYVDHARFDVALSCLLVARRIFDELQSPYSKEAQGRIDSLRKKIGQEQFTALLAKVESQSQRIVDQVLLASEKP